MAKTAPISVRPISDYTLSGLIRRHWGEPEPPLGSNPRYRWHERLAAIFGNIASELPTVASGPLSPLRVDRRLPTITKQLFPGAKKRLRAHLGLNGESLNHWLQVYSECLADSSRLQHLTLGRKLGAKGKNTLSSRCLRFAEKNAEILDAEIGGGIRNNAFQALWKSIGGPDASSRTLKNMLALRRTPLLSQAAFRKSARAAEIREQMIAKKSEEEVKRRLNLKQKANDADIEAREMRSAKKRKQNRDFQESLGVTRPKF